MLLFRIVGSVELLNDISQKNVLLKTRLISYRIKMLIKNMNGFFTSEPLLLSFMMTASRKKSTCTSLQQGLNCNVSNPFLDFPLSEVESELSQVESCTA